MKDNLIDLDIVVDDCRAEVERAVEQLRVAVAARDKAAHQLAALIIKKAA